MGGQDKGFNYKKLARVIKREKKIKAVILLGQNKFEIRKLLSGGKNVFLAKSLKEAILKAKKIAKAGDIVLFSPASASFDMFKNYRERGKKFKEEVKNKF